MYMNAIRRWIIPLLCAACGFAIGRWIESSGRGTRAKGIYENTAPLSIAIVPYKSAESKRPPEIFSSDDESRTFYVLLTNISSQEQNIFETWNKWGYRNITFEVTTNDGRTVVASQRRRDFSMNQPSTFLLRRGESYVIPIKLNGEWEWLPTTIPTSIVDLKAVYEVEPYEPYDSRLPVPWIGRIESQIYRMMVSGR
jgi:hypothetical protein